MEKKTILTAASVVITLIIILMLAGIAAAQRNRGNDNDYGPNGMMGKNMMDKGMIGMVLGANSMHSRMYSVMTNGTYEDLVNLRNKRGYGIMPRIQNEQDFS